MAGRIIDTGTGGTPISVTPNLQTGLGGDPLVEGFYSNLGKIAVTQRYPSAVPTPQPVRVYNAATGANLTPTPPSWSRVTNLQGLVPIGSFLFALDYDTGTVVAINASTYAQVGTAGTYWTPPASLVPSGYKAYGQSIINIGGALYVLFIIADSTFTTYQNSLLVKLTVSGSAISFAGSSDANTAIEKNAFSMAVSGSSIYIASIGGVQSNTGYNAASKIQSVSTSSLSSAPATVLSASASLPYEFRDITVKGSTFYILMGRYDASWNLAGQLVSTTNFSTFTTIDSFTSGAAGYFWALEYTADNDRLWYAKGNSIIVYNASTVAAAGTLSIANLAGAGAYTNINDLSYVSPTGAVSHIRGYQSPVQRSSSPRFAAARAIAHGRPELSPEEWEEVEKQLAAQ